MLSGSSDSLDPIRPVLQHATQGWIPLNPEVQKSVVEKLRNGQYSGSREMLRQELRSDIALYLHCVRELSRAGDGGRSFTDLFDQATEAELLEILSIDSKALSIHSLKRIKDFQSLQLRDIVLGASTALTLAERSPIDTDTVYSSSLLRSVGLLLLAWNYPTAYQDATQQEGRNLDEALHETFGFAPSTLGLALAVEWKLIPEVQHSLHLDEQGDASEGVSQKTVQTLRQFCELGEALAQANNPQYYPRPRKSLPEVLNSVTDILGSHGITHIQESAQSLWSSLASFTSLTMGGDAATSKELPKIVRDPNLENRFLSACPEFMREELIALYEEMRTDAPLDELMRRWINKLLPVAGFTGCAIFTVDLITGHLVPIVKNHVKHILVRPIAPEDGKDDHFVGNAYVSNTPVRTSFSDADGQVVTLWGSSFGKHMKFGALYFESSEISLPPGNELTMFKAVVQAFEDCLNLG